jgi:hypothetical protein
MERSPPFRKRDLTRAVRAIEAAGLAVGWIEIEQDGTLVIVPTAADTVPEDGQGVREA